MQQVLSLISFSFNSYLISLHTCSIGFKCGERMDKKVKSIFNIFAILAMNLDLCGLKLSKTNFYGFLSF